MSQRTPADIQPEESLLVRSLADTLREEGDFTPRQASTLARVLEQVAAHAAHQASAAVLMEVNPRLALFAQAAAAMADGDFERAADLLSPKPH